MSEPAKTVLHDRHVELGAKMVEFAGWQMPIRYPAGIVAEHLATRKYAGLFDVSHMGRFTFSGEDALAFLQHVLTNNAAALEVGQSQYTIIANNKGGAIDDAYLYRFLDDEYLLVVNAANKEKDWNYFCGLRKSFKELEIIDKSSELAMLSLQGPLSRDMLASIINSGPLPEPVRNSLSIVTINGRQVLLARTGYTGEPLCFELFISTDDAVTVWDMLIDRGARPVGLGARDTLRLEAGLPLYGHEFGLDPEQNEIPVFSCPLSRFAVSFSPLKGEFVGKKALMKQFTAHEKIRSRDYSLIQDLPRTIVCVAVTGKGIARAGNKVFAGQKFVGYITSGTMVPYWKAQGSGLSARLTDEYAMRPLCLALLDSDLNEGDKIEIEIRNRKTAAVIVCQEIGNVSEGTEIP